MTNAAFRPERLRHSLFAALLDAREHYDRGLPVVADIVPNETGGTTLTELTYRRLILASVVLGRKLAAFTRPGEHVGVLLPNAVGTVATFFALQSQARVPAMMNFTTGADGMLSCCVAAGIGTILTSRRAVQKGKLDRLVEGIAAKVRVVYLEDVRASIGLLDKLRGMLVARRAERLPGRRNGSGVARAGAVHLGVRGHAESRGAQPSRAAGQLRATAVGRGFHTRRTGCSMRCRCSTHSA